MSRALISLFAIRYPHFEVSSGHRTSGSTAQHTLDTLEQSRTSATLRRSPTYVHSVSNLRRADIHLGLRHRNCKKNGISISEIDMYMYNNNMCHRL